MAWRIVPADAPEWFEFAALPKAKRHTSSTVETLADVEAGIRRVPARMRTRRMVGGEPRDCLLFSAIPPPA